MNQKISYLSVDNKYVLGELNDNDLEDEDDDPDTDKH